MATEDDVRAIALSLPSTIERPSYGTPGFRVQDRLFARLHDEAGVLVAHRSSIEDRDSLVLSAPEKFFAPDHYLLHAIVLVRLAAVDNAELGELLEEAWESKASARLRQERIFGKGASSSRTPTGEIGTLG